jgi:hypothetical protein
MKTKIVTSTFLAATLFAFGMGASANRSIGAQTLPGPTAQAQPNAGMMQGGMMGGSTMDQGKGQTQGMMRGGTMGQMAAHHQQMAELMEKLMQSMTALQNEKDPEALKSKLAEHQALLNQMHGQMMRQGQMMQMMSGQMKQNCPAGGKSAKPKTE